MLREKTKGALVKPLRLLPLVGLVAFAVLVTAACSEISLDLGSKRVSGGGDIVTETRGVAGFDRVVLAGEGKVLVTAGTDDSLSIETDDNLLAYIESEVSGSKLILSTRDGYDIEPSHDVVYRVTVADLRGIELLGAGSIRVDGVATGDLDIRLAGAGTIEVLDIDGSRLDVDLPGAGSITVAGEVVEQTVTLPGAGSYRAGDLRSRIASVEATGVGGATVWVTADLTITTSGVGAISYYGSPTLDEHVTGVASIQSLGEK